METSQKSHVINVNDHGDSNNSNNHVESDDEELQRSTISRRSFSSESGNGGLNNEIAKDSVCSNDELVDLECGIVENKVHLSKVERDCRICHLSLDSVGNNQDSGVNFCGNGTNIPIELGCSCKDDLAAAHKHCAEAWFKIKGNKTCEICGSVARNVTGPNEVELVEQWIEANDAASATAAAPSVHTTETRHFWQGHRFLNFLLACMVFAFVISWLFHFNVPS